MVVLIQRVIVCRSVREWRSVQLRACRWSGYCSLRERCPVAIAPMLTPSLQVVVALSALGGSMNSASRVSKSRRVVRVMGRVEYVDGEWHRQKQTGPDGAHAIAAIARQAHLVIAHLKPQPPTALSAPSGA